jgi:quercetin dioxygenase-like cupin family protein
LLEGLLVHLPADGRWCGPFAHEGEEVGFVLEGRLELIVEGQTYAVPSGSSFFFPSTNVHRYRAAGAKRCRVVWINTPANF